MKSVNCPEHADTVLHLARGLVNPGEAARAELIRTDCAHCAAWWTAELDGRRFPEVDASVEQALRAFAPPQRQRRVRRDYLVAAATVALAVGVLIFASDTPDSQESRELADSPVAGLSGHSAAEIADPDLILAEGFEMATEAQPLGLTVLVGVEGEGFRDDIHGVAEERSPDMIFRSGLEVGGLAAWNDHS